MKDQMQAIMDQKLLLHEEKLKLEKEKSNVLQAKLDATNRSEKKQKDATPTSVGNNKNKSKFDYVNNYDLLPGPKPAETEIDAEELNSIRSTLQYSFDVTTGMSTDSPGKHRRSNIVASPAPVPGVRYHNNNTLVRTCLCNAGGTRTPTWLSSLKKHPNFRKLYDENHKNFDKCVVGPKPRAKKPDEPTLMMADC
jgi:hypothetical protein